MKKLKKRAIEASWSGEYPCLCHGSWTISIGGKDCTKEIPKKMRTESMNTFGTYQRWSFDPGWREEWESYEDGLPSDEWIQANIKWIQKLPLKNSEYADLFAAFQKEDFRLGQCGGCI